MITQYKNFLLRRGDTFKFYLTLLNIPGEVSGVDMVIGKHCEQENALVLTLGDGITPAEGQKPKFVVFLDKEKTALLDNGVYEYAIHAEYGEERGTAFMGEVTVEDNRNA